MRVIDLLSYWLNEVCLQVLTSLDAWNKTIAFCLCALSNSVALFCVNSSILPSILLSDHISLLLHYIFTTMPQYRTSEYHANRRANKPTPYKYISICDSFPWKSTSQVARFHDAPFKCKDTGKSSWYIIGIKYCVLSLLKS